jgi:hypothetical protein
MCESFPVTFGALDGDKRGVAGEDCSGEGVALVGKFKVSRNCGGGCISPMICRWERGEKRTL